MNIEIRTTVTPLTMDSKSVEEVPVQSPTDITLVTSKEYNPKNPNGIFTNLKKCIKHHLGPPPNPNLKSGIHKSLQTLNSNQSSAIMKQASSYEGNIRDLQTDSDSGSGSKSLCVTTDVPSDIWPLKDEQQKAAEQLGSLSTNQVEQIKKEWLVIKQHIEKIGVIIFLGLFEKHSDFRDAFAQFRGRQLKDITHDPALQAHGLRVLSVVDKLVTRLPKTDLVQEHILCLGKKHCRYVPSISLIPYVGTQLIQAIQPVLQDKQLWNDEAEKCWKIVLTYLTTTLRYGLAKNSLTITST